MPVITLYIPKELCSEQYSDVSSQFQEKCASLCIQRLGASPEKVQIQILVACLPPLGRPVYAEVKYRQNPNRDADLMTLFMEELEGIISLYYSVGTPRIRCFPQSSESLYARN